MVWSQLLSALVLALSMGYVLGWVLAGFFRVDQRQEKGEPTDDEGIREDRGGGSSGASFDLGETDSVRRGREVPVALMDSQR